MHHSENVDVAGTEIGENACLDRGHEGDLSAKNGRGHFEANVFQMDVSDAIECVFCKLDRVLATERHVSGVEAEVHVATVEDPGNVVFCLDERLYVRVQNLLNPVFATDVIDDTEHLDHVTLFFGRQCTRVCPAPVLNGRGHHLCRACLLEQFRGRRRARDGRFSFGGIVNHHRSESSEQRDAVFAEFCGQFRRVFGEEPHGAQFGCGESQSRHLAQNAARREHGSPIGNLADSPRDGGGRDAGEKVGHGKPFVGTLQQVWQTKSPHRKTSQKCRGGLP